MPSKTNLLKFGPFVGGKNSRKKPWLLDPTEGQDVIDADTRTGSLSGTLDISASVSVNGAYLQAQWIWPVGGGTWLFANERRWAMNDGDKTYFTRSGNQPQSATADGTASDLGIRPPSSISWTINTPGDSLSGTFKYGISYITFDGHESNIQPFDLQFTFPLSTNKRITFPSTAAPATATIWPTDPRVSSVQLWRTTDGGNIFYRVSSAGNRIGSVTNRTDKYLVDDGSLSDVNLATLAQLTWAVGGFPQSTGQYTSDRSAAPVLTRLADRIHSQASGTAVSGSGIVFGAQGNILRWSQVGQPWYWPTVNNFPFDHQIEALIAYSGYLVVFTTGGIYRVAGNNDDAMEAERLSAFYNIRPKAGKTCLRTPHGTIYLAVEGLAVFDGSQARPVLTNKQLSTDFDGVTIYDAAYFNDKYYLFHSGGYIRVDLKDGWEGARWNTSATVFNCVATGDFKNPLVGDAKRAIPLTVQATAIGLRSFGFCAGYGATFGNYVFLIGGSYLDFTTGLGEIARDTAYALDVSTASGIWQAGGTFATLPTDGTDTERMNATVVYVNGKLYVFGGRYGPATAYSSSTAICTLNSTISSSTWANDATAGGPGAIISHAAASDVTGGDTTGFWVQGGIDSSSAVKSALYKFTIGSPNSWASIGSGGPALLEHGLVYVPGAVFTDNHPRLFIFGGTTSDANANAQDTIYCFDLTTATTWTNDTGSDSGVTSAQAAGVAKRRRHVWAYDQVSKRIFLHGGHGSDGGVLSDIWEFDPRVWVDAGSGARITAWKNTSGAVVNVLERRSHGGAIVPGTASPVTGQTLYLAAGSSSANLFNSDLYAVYVQALTGPNNPNYSTTAGVYGLKPSNGGNIYRLEGGVAQQATWRTGDILGENSASIKYVPEAVFDYVGDVRVDVYADTSAVQTCFTLSSATQTQTKKKFPWSGNTAARGKRLSFQFVCLTAAAATLGVAGELLSAHVQVVEQFGD